jgi:hypothetical protein
MGVSTIEELRQMRSSKQVMRVEEVLKLLADHGFEYRRSKHGTSHIFVSHSDFPEIPSFNVVGQTKKLRSQMDAIDACIQFLKILSENEAQEEFNEAVNAQEPKTETPIKIPKNYELLRGRKNPKLFIRHKEFPQMATEVEEPITQAWIDEYEKYLDKRLNDFKTLLDTAVSDFEFEMEQNPNGRIILTHPDNNTFAIFNPFTPRHENFTVIGKLEELLEWAKEDRENHTEQSATGTRKGSKAQGKSAHVKTGRRNQRPPAFTI